MACTDTSHTSKVGQDRLRESSVKYELSVWKRKIALVSTPCQHVNVFIENEIGRIDVRSLLLHIAISECIFLC